MRTAIFPARGGSQRIPRKNIRDFMGKPMLQWPIEAAKDSGLFTHLVVSTDDQEIAALAHRLDCEVHMREPDDGSVGTQVLAGRVLEWMQADGEACVIYPCSPMLQSADLLLTHRQWLRDPKRYLSMAVRVSEVEAHDAGCAYWGFAGSFRAGVPYENGPIVNGSGPVNHYVQLVDPARFIDINDPADWAKAESMFNALHP